MKNQFIKNLYKTLIWLKKEIKLNFKIYFRMVQLKQNMIWINLKIYQMEQE